MARPVYKFHSIPEDGYFYYKGEMQRKVTNLTFMSLTDSVLGEVMYTPNMDSDIMTVEEKRLADQGLLEPGSQGAEIIPTPVADLKQQIQDLRQQIALKDAEINSLKSEAALRDQQIKSAESRANLNAIGGPYQHNA